MMILQIVCSFTRDIFCSLIRINNKSETQHLLYNLHAFFCLTFWTIYIYTQKHSLTVARFLFSPENYGKIHKRVFIFVLATK